MDLSLIKIEFFDGISRTAAYPLLINAHAELLAKGWSEPVPMVCWDHQVFVASVLGEPIGVLSFSHSKWARQLDVQTGWVRPDYRRLGVYRLLWNALVEKARELSAVTIFGNTHVDNLSLRATACALGRVEVGVIMKFDVPPAAEQA